MATSWITSVFEIKLIHPEFVKISTSNSLDVSLIKSIFNIDNQHSYQEEYNEQESNIKQSQIYMYLTIHITEFNSITNERSPIPQVIIYFRLYNSLRTRNS